MFPSNVRKLITKEDPMHLHKTLGFLSMLHFIYRFTLLLRYGTMRLDTPLAVGMMAVHGALSVSSLVFPIPQKRHATLPMIYPEFRLHSILFGLRSVICCLVEYYCPVHLRLYSKMGVCWLSMMLADWVTAQHAVPGDTTMRAMPFAETVPVEDRARITRFHSNQQTSATMFMLCNLDTAFSPLLAIQLAAFLMTLVRKNIIAPNTWHLVYSWSLMVNIFTFRTIAISHLVQVFLGIRFFRTWRMRWRQNKYVGWSLVFAIIAGLDWSWLDDDAYSHVGRWLSNGLIAAYLVKNVHATKRLYKPLVDRLYSEWSGGGESRPDLIHSVTCGRIHTYTTPMI